MSTLDTIALWIGWIVLGAGGFLLATAIVAGLLWTAGEYGLCPILRHLRIYSHFAVFTACRQWKRAEIIERAKQHREHMNRERHRVGKDEIES